LEDGCAFSLIQPLDISSFIEEQKGVASQLLALELFLFALDDFNGSHECFCEALSCSDDALECILWARYDMSRCLKGLGLASPGHANKGAEEVWARLWIEETGIE
jgi:hypothetical protein